MSGIRDEVEALRHGTAFARDPSRRIVRVGGPEPANWLHDLLTADVAGLVPGQARRSFLLTPTGRIRADLWVVRRETDLVLLQPDGAGAPIEASLAPYVLTSGVTLSPAPDLAVVGLPSGAAPDDAFTPSWLGASAEVLVPVGPALDDLLGTLRGAGHVEASTPALEWWRVIRGDPRMGVDFDETTLPSEVGLDDVVAEAKGCFLGQESVAKIRNLGHPPTVLRHLEAPGAMAPGDEVASQGDAAGVVTSVALDGHRTVALVRVAWASRDAALHLPDGRPLRHVAEMA